MTVFNFLLEATVFGSVLALLVFALRSLLRGKLGNRFIYGAWLIVALRLLIPLALPNPAMDALRPDLSVDVAARPLADQLRRRIIDFSYDVSGVLASQPAQRFAQHTRDGNTGRWLLLVWLGAAALVGGYFMLRGLRVCRTIRRNRVCALHTQQPDRCHALCLRYGVKDVPVYLVDRLSASCIVGFTQPFIALPYNTPEAHIDLALSHELCHLRAHDPFWNVVRDLCRALHWFNPLIWLACWLSRVDSELACDDRVLSRLPPLDCLAYADVVASAADRVETAPRLQHSTRRMRTLRRRITGIISSPRTDARLVALTSLAAAVALAISFATGESRPLPTVADVPQVTWVSAPAALHDEAAAIAAARRLLESDFIGADTSALAFAARTQNGAWYVTADGAPAFSVVYAPDGSLLEYDGMPTDRGAPRAYTHSALTDSVHSYLTAFTAAYAPTLAWHSGAVTADITLQGLRYIDGVLTDADGRSLCYFTLQIAPSTRLLYCCIP